MTTFKDLDLVPALQRALTALKYEVPTPIQAQAIPPLLAGRDVLGCAQTGTGKTAAFSLPVLQHLANSAPSKGKPRIRVLVLTPTRELAAQLGESFQTYGKFLKTRHTVIFGGVNEGPQISALRRGVDIVVATPGRLLDLHNRRHVNLGAVDFFVLDEADRMLDMGFINDIKKILGYLPQKRQNLLFSATMPKAISSLAGSLLTDPVSIEVTPESTTVELIDQTMMFVDKSNKKNLLTEILLAGDVGRAIVFTRTKHGANKLVTALERSQIKAVAIHGNKTQAARKRALADFRKGKTTILVATDIASRGIDVDDVTHVFNYDLPIEPEVYVHRIGRTGRAGRTGVAISFCDMTEGGCLRAIERTIGQSIPVNAEHAFHLAAAIPRPGRSYGSPKRSGGGNRRHKQGGRSGTPRKSFGGRDGRRSGSGGGYKGKSSGGGRGGPKRSGSTSGRKRDAGPATGAKKATGRPRRPGKPSPQVSAAK